MNHASSRSTAQARTAAPAATGPRVTSRSPISADGWSRLGETIVRMARAAAAMHAAEVARHGSAPAPRLEVRA